MIMFSTDKAMGHPCELQLFDINDLNQISKYIKFFVSFSFTTCNN